MCPGGLSMSVRSSIEDVQLGACVGVNLLVGPSDKAHSSQGEQNLRAMLFEERQRLSKLELDIDHLQSTLSRLHKERESCTARMNEYSAALSPHKHLPPEILSNIFVLSMGDRPTTLRPHSTELPWVLLRVCSRWRQIALAEHRLWNRLDLVSSSPHAELVDSVISAWIPRLWGSTQIFPVSLTLTVADEDIALHNVLLPYFRRIQSLSLNVSANSLAGFLISPPAPFECLESLELDFSYGVPSNMRLISYVEAPPPTIFMASPSLREVTFTARAMNAIEFHAAVSGLPWAQLAHVTFHMVRISLRTLESVLRRCASLTSLTFTSLNEGYDPSAVASIPEIHLPLLRSITLIADNSPTASSIFELIRAPSLEEFTLEHMDRRYYGSRALWNHSQLLKMLSRSEARLRYLNLSSRLGGIGLENLLPGLPHLRKLRVSEANPVPGSIFDGMVRGEVLRVLEHLECLTLSPVPFLRLLRYQYEFKGLGEGRGLVSAVVSYKEPELTREKGDWIEMYAGLRPVFEDGRKAIVLNEIDRGTG